MQVTREAFRNLSLEGKFVVQRGARPLYDFNDKDTLTKSHPLLFPYGHGGFVETGPNSLTFEKCARCLMLYDDKRFRMHRSFVFELFSIMQKKQIWRGASAQMKQGDFARLAPALLNIMLEDMKRAVAEETEQKAISNPAIQELRRAIKASSVNVMGSDQSRIHLRFEMWVTIVVKGPPFIWLTINPNDNHDPIMQFLAGENIDLENFNNTFIRDDPSKRLKNIVDNPYAATKFFQAVINAILVYLMGVRGKRGSIQTTGGIFGDVDAYFGVVEAQGRGSLHVHFLIWLKNTPQSSDLKEMFEDQIFRERLKEYIRKVVKPSLRQNNTANV